MNKFIFLLALITISSTAIAGNATGKIIGFIPYAQGTEEIFFINVENLTGTPSCNNSLRFTMKGSDPKFKATQAAVLAAFMAGTQVIAKGAGTCNNFGNSEDLNYICLGYTPC